MTNLISHTWSICSKLTKIIFLQFMPHLHLLRQCAVHPDLRQNLQLDYSVKPLQAWSKYIALDMAASLFIQNASPFTCFSCTFIAKVSLKTLISTSLQVAVRKKAEAMIWLSQIWMTLLCWRPVMRMDNNRWSLQTAASQIAPFPFPSPLHHSKKHCLSRYHELHSCTTLEKAAAVGWNCHFGHIPQRHH